MDLSICLIVKNEEGNLLRCLDSLAAIIVEDWCELIVVDTGSTDRTIEVAKKYTDNIYYREWDNDFSAARNYAISQAIGFRVLIFDADEQLSQQSLYILQDYILNPEYKKYPTFFFKIFNYYNKENSQYTEFMQPRCFIRKGFEYHGTVHNKPKAKAPFLWCDDIMIYHYGYKFEDNKKLAEKKFNRTLPMLLEEYDKNPDDIHIISHLVKTYKMSHDQENILKYGNMFLDKFRMIKYHKGWFAYLEVFTIMCQIYLRRDDIQNAERIKREIERYSDRVTSLYLLFGLHYKGLDNDKAAYYFDKAIQIWRVEGDPHEDLLTTNVNIIMPEIYNWLALYCYKKGLLKKSGKLLNEGILFNRNRLPLRWDIFRARVA